MLSNRRNTRRWIPSSSNQPRRYAGSSRNLWSRTFTGWGTKSDRIGWVINAILGGFTVALFFLTQSSVSEARRANNIADSNYQLANRQFNLSRVQQAIQDSSDSVKFELQMAMNRASLRLTEAQTTIGRQEAEANESFFTYDSVGVFEMEKNRWFFVAAVSLHGRTRVQMDFQTIAVINETKKFFQSNTVPGPVTYTPETESRAILSNRYVPDSIARHEQTTIYIEIKYHDLSTGKQKIYRNAYGWYFDHRIFPIQLISTMHLQMGLLSEDEAINLQKVLYKHSHMPQTGN